MSGWRQIGSAPKDVFVFCCNVEKKWMRVGRYYSDVGRWYYSGTNERSQYAQVEGDSPTHWMLLPELPRYE